MTTEEIQAIFEARNDQYIKDENIDPERRLHKRPDLNAFLLLDKIKPGKRDIIAWSKHDEFGLDYDLEDITEASEEDIIDLIRCGVRYDSVYDTLFMFS